MVPFVSFTQLVSNKEDVWLGLVPIMTAKYKAYTVYFTRILSVPDDTLVTVI